MASVKVDKTAISRMLDQLFGLVVEDGQRIFVACDGNFAGWWLPSVEEAATKIATIARTKNVWIGVGTRSEPPAPDEDGKVGRGLEEEIETITALWLDVDVMNPVHKKAERLPPDYGAAIDLIDRTFYGARPSMLVDSGHGIQAWWLLDEPWVFDDEEDRAAAKALSTRFSATFKIASEEKGWTVDSVFDLSRLLRPIGSVNRKVPDEPKPVKILRRDFDLRWSREDLEAVCVAEEFLPDRYRGDVVAPMESVGRLSLRPDASPPMSKFAALMGNVEDAKLSFENRRPDFSDQSPSSYDMSLATLAVQASWSDQEIADLLIAHRRERGHNLKTTGRGLLRQDYYQRTIARAREGLGRRTVTQDLNEGVSAGPTIAGASVAPEERARILRDASYVLGVKIDRFVQFGDGEDASYILELDGGRKVTIGNSTAIQSQKIWCSKLFPVSRRLFEPLKPRGWVSLVNSLATVVDYEENIESSRFEQITDLITTYLSSTLTRAEEDIGVAIKAGNPYVQDGALYLSRIHLDQWARASQTKPPDIQDTQTALRSLGFRQTKVYGRVAGRPVSKRYWSAALDDCGDALGVEGVGVRADQGEPR